MPEETSQQKNTELFISYSRKNNEFVGRLIAGLEAKGVGLWFDQEDIDQGRKWWDEVRRGIIEANAFVFVISPDSLRSQVCHWELAFARQHNKRIIPFLIDDQVVTPSLANELQELTWRNPEGEQVKAAENWASLQSINFIVAKRFTPTCFDQVVGVARADFEYIDAHKRFLVRAHEWELKGKKPAFVLTGGDLKEAQAWLTASSQKEPPPLALHREHIAASLRRAKNQRRRLLVATLGSLVTIAVIALFGLRQSQIAEERDTERATQQAIAEREGSTARSRKLATTALSLASDPTQYDVSLVLAVEAYRQNPTYEAYNSLLSLLQRSDRPIGYAHYNADDPSVEIPPSWGIVLQPREESEVITRILDNLNEELLPGAGWITTVAKSQTAEWYAVAFCPEGEGMRFCEHNVLRVYDLSNGSVITEIDRGHENIIFSLAFSPDNQHLASGSDDSTLRIWDIRTGRLTLTIPHPYYVISLAYSRSGAMIASGTGTASNADSIEATIRLWDATTGELIGTLLGHKWTVSRLEFSSDGHRLASWDDNWVGGYTETILLWNIEGLPVLERGAIDYVPNSENVNPNTSQFDDTIIAISDDQRLVAESSGGTSILAIKEVNSDTVLATLATLGGVGARDPYNYAASIAKFSPDNRFIASFHRDRVVRLWDIQSQEPVFELQDNSLILDRFAFNPSGTTLAFGGCEVDSNQVCTQGRVYLLDVATALLIGSPLFFDAVDLLSWTDESELIVIDGDQSIYWEIAPDRLAQDACIMANRDLTQEEWQRYLGNLPYHRTCSDYLRSMNADAGEFYTRNFNDAMESTTTTDSTEIPIFWGDFGAGSGEYIIAEEPDFFLPCEEFQNAIASMPPAFVTMLFLGHSDERLEPLDISEYGFVVAEEPTGPGFNRLWVFRMDDAEGCAR